MRVYSATEAKQSFAGVLTDCLRAPVIIQKQNQDVAVVLSIEEYQRLTQRNTEEFLSFAKKIGQRAEERGLTEEKLAELLADE